MMEFIYALTDPIMLAGVLAAFASFAAIITVASPLMSADKLGSRLKAVAERREELRRKSRAALDKATPSARLRPEAKGLMNEIVQRLNLQTLLEDPTLQAKLVQAGLRGPRPVSIFYFCRFALPFAFAIATWIYTSINPALNITGTKQLIAVVFGLVIGFYAPNIYLTNIIQKRRQSIMQAFPDALDMLLICVESGMSIEAALHRVAAEIGPASVELAEELSLTTAELSYLQERRIAYENLARRTNHPGVKSVAMALTQAERYGTPLGNALRVMSKENRELRVAEAEKKAAALPAQLTVPMIVFFLPVLFAVIMGPALIQISKIMK